MQLPSIDRVPNLRPSGAEMASVSATRVIPVAPVNPSVHIASAAVENAPGVVNLVNQANKPSHGEGIYTSVSDPAQRGSEAATASKDWTIQRPTPEKVEDPPPVPISKLLLDQIKSLWLASASAVQVQQQVRSQLDTSHPSPDAIPGQLAKQVLTYSPSKINKTDHI